MATVGVPESKLVSSIGKNFKMQTESRPKHSLQQFPGPFPWMQGQCGIFFTAGGLWVLEVLPAFGTSN